MTERAPARPLLTYLFSDVVGSTALWERQRDAMERDLARHDALMAATIERWGGTVFKTAGDAFYAVFANPTSSLAAAVEAQRHLQTESWSVDGGLRVRMALHTGESDHRRGDYFGPALNRTARILGLADAGHILVSEATANIVREAVSAGVTLHDHGMRALKGIAAPTHIFQAVYDAPLGGIIALTEAAPAPTNLPAPATPLIGRETALATLAERIATHGMVTIAGLGGVGKSVLAHHVAHAVRDRYPHGTWLVDLAQITDPEIVPLQLAATIGGDATDALVIIDNCETLLQAASDAVAGLRAARPNVHVIATTREALHVPGEFVWRLAPLAAVDGVALLVERIRARDQAFELDDENATAARRIVDALDGIPLALELAAARCAGIALDEVARRLDDRFRFLKASSGGGRRALREIVAWSFEGVSAEEKIFLHRLAVFPGTWSLEAAEAIAGDAPLDDDVIDLLGGCVDKSLVQLVPESKRYRFLQTIRVYARDLETGDPLAPAALARRHADFYRDLVIDIDETDPRTRGRAYERADLERENVRVALQYFIDAGDDDETALELAAAMRGFWVERGYPQEGRVLLARALERSSAPLDHPKRLRARLTLATLDTYLGAYEAARREAQAVLDLARPGGDAVLIADALNAVAVAATYLGDTAAAEELYRESVERCSADGYRAGEARALYNLGAAAANRGDAAAARDAYERSLVHFRALRDRWRMGWVLTGLARLDHEAGRIDEAQAAATEALEIRRSIGDRRGVLETLVLAADIALAADDLEGARAILRDLYANAWTPEFPTETGLALVTTVRWLLAAGAARTGALVFGFHESLVQNSESKFTWSNASSLDELEDALRVAVGTAALEAERSAGYLRDADAIVRAVRTALG